MDQFNLLLAALTGFASSATTGFLKGLDTRITAKLGNLTPVLVIALGFLLPKLATLLHLAAIPDATALVNAPLSTAIAILSREALVRFFPKATAP